MKTVKIWRHGHEGVLAGETETHSHVPPEYSPTFQWGKNISSEFDFMVMLPPTWFLFTLGVAALLPTHCAFVSSFFLYNSLLFKHDDWTVSSFPEIRAS